MGNLITGPLNVMIGNILTIAIITAIVYYILWKYIVKGLESFFTKIIKPAVESAVKDVKSAF